MRPIQIRPARRRPLARAVLRPVGRPALRRRRRPLGALLTLLRRGA